MSYVEFHDEMPDHPKTRRLARRLQIDRPMACWYVLRTHHWAMKYAPDGDLSDHDREDIAEFVDWPGEPGDLLDAMEAAGFIDPDGCLHDWRKFGGKYIEARRKGNKRQADYRARVERQLHGDDDDEGDASRDGHSTVSDRRDKRREEKISGNEKREHERNADERSGVDSSVAESAGARVASRQRGNGQDAEASIADAGIDDAIKPPWDGDATVSDFSTEDDGMPWIDDEPPWDFDPASNPEDDETRPWDADRHRWHEPDFDVDEAERRGMPIGVAAAIRGDQEAARRKRAVS